jgi:hypothetical protein
MQKYAYLAQEITPAQVHSSPSFSSFGYLGSGLKMPNQQEIRH